MADLLICISTLALIRNETNCHSVCTIQFYKPHKFWKFPCPSSWRAGHSRIIAICPCNSILFNFTVSLFTLTIFTTETAPNLCFSFQSRNVPQFVKWRANAVQPYESRHVRMWWCLEMTTMLPRLMLVQIWDSHAGAQVHAEGSLHKMPQLVRFAVLGRIHLTRFGFFTT